MKAEQSKSYEIQQKQFQEGSLYQYNFTSRNKKYLRQPNLTPLQLEKEEQTKSKLSTGKENTKIRAETNEIETKKTKFNDTKSEFLTKLVNLQGNSSEKNRDDSNQ